MGVRGCSFSPYTTGEGRKVEKKERRERIDNIVGGVSSLNVTRVKTLIVQGGGKVTRVG